MRRHDKLKKDLQKRVSSRRHKQPSSMRWRRSNALPPEQKLKHVRPENAKLVSVTQSKHWHDVRCVA